MTKTIRIGGFIKIGHKDHIDSLQKSGRIYSNSIKYFRDIEEDELRNDGREGSIKHIVFKNNSRLTIKDDANVEHEFMFQSGHYNEYDSNIDMSHLYCLLFFNPKDVTGKPFINPKNLKFGDSALLITDPNSFIKRIIEFTKHDFKTIYGPVHYFDDKKTHESLTVFDKPEYFNYQKEFRFNFLIFEPGPLQFDIGSIEDISVQIDSQKLVELSIRGNDNVR